MFGLTQYANGMLRELENRFNSRWRQALGRRETIGCEIYENDKDFLLLCAVPGFEREDIDVELKDGFLAIRTAHKEESGDKPADGSNGEASEADERFTSERKMETVFKLSNKIDADKIGVELADGVLRVTLPKLPEAQARKIAVK